MEIYMVDGETKEYIGAEDALLDPLETKKAGKACLSVAGECGF